ncbi:hypothetical protein LINPERHAP2_LOCUS26260 [Linum perenne]
MLANLI